MLICWLNTSKVSHKGANMKGRGNKTLEEILVLLRMQAAALPLWTALLDNYKFDFDHPYNFVNQVRKWYDKYGVSSLLQDNHKLNVLEQLPLISYYRSEENQFEEELLLILFHIERIEIQLAFRQGQLVEARFESLPQFKVILTKERVHAFGSPNETAQKMLGSLQDFLSSH